MTTTTRPKYVLRQRPSAARQAVALVGLLGVLISSPVAAIELLWFEDDWSGGNYMSTETVDPEISPGHLVLEPKLNDIRYLATPTDFQGINSLASYHDSLWLACSDHPYTYDGADVLSYDYLTGNFNLEYQPYESGLHMIRVFGDTMYLPGPDSMDPWYSPGSIYTYDGQEWLEKATLDSAVHVNDVEIVNGILFTTTGHMDGTGGVWMSHDYGETFTRCLTLDQSVGHPIRRFFGAGQYQGRVFVQPDGFDPEGKVLYSSSDGIEWETHSVAGMQADMHATFTVYGDSLLMAVNNKLFIWDGLDWTWEYLPFTGWRWCRGYYMYRGELYAGGSSCKIYRWISGPDWELMGEMGIDPATEEIESIVTHYGRFYVSTSRPEIGMPGRIYVSAAMPGGRLVSGVHDFEIATEDGFLYWDEFRPGPANVARFQLRSSATFATIEDAEFVGPDGTTGSYYTSPGMSISMVHDQHRYFQYAVELLCPAGMDMPVLHSVSLVVEEILGSGIAEPNLSGDPLESSEQTIRLLSPQPAINWEGIQLQITPPNGDYRRAGDLTRPAFVRLSIVDTQGRRVRSARVPLDNGGGATWHWDQLDQEGCAVASGVYRAILEDPSRSAGRQASRSLVLLR